MGNINNEIAGLEAEIKNEARRMAINTQEKHEETQRKLEEARTTVTELESAIHDLIIQRKDKGFIVDDIRPRGEELERQLERLKKTITDCEATIGMARRREQDAFIPYGQNIKMALEKIKASRWYGDIPLGPLGLYVTAKEPRVWGDLLRNQLGSLLTAFAITNSKDRQQLKQILQSFGK